MSQLYRNNNLKIIKYLHNNIKITSNTIDRIDTFEIMFICKNNYVSLIKYLYNSCVYGIYIDLSSSMRIIIECDII